MDRLITFRWQARSLGLYAIGRFEYKVSKHSGEVKYVYIYWLGVRPFYFIGQGLWEDEPKIVYGKAVRPQEATMFLKKRPCSPTLFDITFFVWKLTWIRINWNRTWNDFILSLSRIYCAIYAILVRFPCETHGRHRSMRLKIANDQTIWSIFHKLVLATLNGEKKQQHL